MNNIQYEQYQYWIFPIYNTMSNIRVPRSDCFMGAKCIPKYKFSYKTPAFD